MNILLVEDDKDIREMLALFLTSMGHRPIRLKHGREALEAVWAHVDFDLVVCDLLMPEMDGYELIGHLRDIGCVLPIIVVTGIDDSSSVKGADVVLQKPIRKHALSAAITRVCAARHIA
ncbi:response regulator [Patescibacteria group bacterium]